MGYRKISACVGCAECRFCFRYGKSQLEFYCDQCGSENEELFDVNGEQLCLDCAAEVFATQEAGKCDDCEVTNYLFEIEGKRVCDSCMQDYLNEIDYEVD